MRRLSIVVVALLLALAAIAAWGTAPSAGRVATGAAPTVKPKKKKVKLPPKPTRAKLPAEVRQRGKWVIGVKCDFAPFGFIDAGGKNDGYDVEVARRLAQLAFGSKTKLDLVCVTTPSRIPTLQSKRVDVIVSTLTWTKARTDVIAYSIPYYSATGRLLVPNSSSIRTVRNLAGKTIVTTRGALYAAWTRNCFKDSKLLEVDSPALAVSAVKNGTADTFMFDDAFLLGVATQDSTLKLTNDRFLAIPWGIGIRKGEGQMAAWVNTAIRYMRARDEFAGILRGVGRRTGARAALINSFLENVPRPKNRFTYPFGKDPVADCSSR
jgi:polar amino acid transport system substrate-binding protein